MIEFLLYSQLSCSDADAIMFRMKNKKNLNDQVKIELIEAVKESTPECYPWDAHDWRNGKTDPSKDEKVQFHPTFRSKLMTTTITYRGQKYDKDAYKASVLAQATQQRNHNLMYRGIKVERKFASKSWLLREVS